MTIDGQQARLTALAALKDPLDRRCFDLVAADSDAVGRDEIAEALGLPRASAAFRLDRLVEVGLLDVEFRRRSGRTGPGAGRPAKLYRVALPGAGRVSAGTALRARRGHPRHGGGPGRRGRAAAHRARDRGIRAGSGDRTDHAVHRRRARARRVRAGRGRCVAAPDQLPVPSARQKSHGHDLRRQPRLAPGRPRRAPGRIRNEPSSGPTRRPAASGCGPPTAEAGASRRRVQHRCRVGPVRRGCCARAGIMLDRALGSGRSEPSSDASRPRSRGSGGGPRGHPRRLRSRPRMRRCSHHT